MTFPTEPTVSLQAHTKLEYPYTSPTTTVLLPNPLFGNSDRISQTRIYTETQDGTLILSRDGIWPKDNELAQTFSEVTSAQKVALQAFIALTLGKEFKLTDYVGQVFKAIITNPETEFVCDSDECGGKYTVSLTFNVEV